MFISREADYALRIIRVLAAEEKVTAVHIANSEQIPQAFAYKIVRKLSKAGLIKVKRGIKGGCQLNCDLAKTSLYELLVAVDEPLGANACTQEGYVCEWVNKHPEKKCHLHESLGELEKKIHSLLKELTLQEMIYGEK